MDAELVRAGYERKFRVPDSHAPALLAALGRLLAPDPLAGPTGEYAVSSLYLDTPDWAAYHREAGGKWRLRRYGDEAQVYAEFKGKPATGRVHKRRLAFSLDRYAQLPGGPHDWFVDAVHKHALLPTRLVTYRRRAFVGVLDRQTVRLTVDREVRARAESRFVVPGPLEAGAPLTDGRILEIKFESALPEALAALVQSLGLLPESFSKYRAAVEATGGRPEPDIPLCEIE